MSNMKLKMSALNNNDTVKTTMRTCQAEDVDSVEVVATVVVAVVVVVPMAEEMGVRHLVIETATLMEMGKAPENKGKCSNHIVLGNTRWTLMTLSKNRSSCKCKRISRMQRRHLMP